VHTGIIYYDIEGKRLYYSFEVIKVALCNNPNALGEYVPAKNRDENKPCIKITPRATEFTVYHEALHACIDFFRTTMPDDFNEIFDDSCIYAEEAFVHYFKAFCDATKTALNKT
jgi:hypothetical protein